MFSAILILLLLPITDVSRSRGMQFRPLSKWAFFVFVANFLILMQLGAKHVESPFIEFGQISTVLYFLYFTVVMYGVTFIENTFVDLNFYTNTKHSSRFNSITKNDKSCNMNIKTSSFLSYPLLRSNILKTSIYSMNIKKLSCLANSNAISFTIFIGIDMDTDKERLVPLIWDKDELLFIRDLSKQIHYKGSSCVVDEDKDNTLAQQLIIDYLKDENVCVCSS